MILPPADTQRLLFGETPRVGEFSPRARAPGRDFVRDGFAVISGIESPEEAAGAAYEVLAAFAGGAGPIAASLGASTLVKHDRIPVCHDILPRAFQGLHFDMGLPLLPSPYPHFTAVALFIDPRLESPQPQAATRILPLHELSLDSDPSAAEANLVRYVRAFGDGWSEFTPTNTMRLALLARVLEGMVGNDALAGQRDYSTGRWFNEANGVPEVALRCEQAFYENLGIALSSLERRVVLRPGDLLVIDNARCAHGRIGPRREREVHQLLFAVPGLAPDDVGSLRRWLCRTVCG